MDANNNLGQLSQKAKFLRSQVLAPSLLLDSLELLSFGLDEEESDEELLSLELD